MINGFHLKIKPCIRKSEKIETLSFWQVYEEFEGIRSHILNVEKLDSIGEVYSQVEVGQQHQVVMVGKHRDVN